ncbi:MAG TPA: hypothetical protein VFH78_05495 [Candidatus Thermoplasmatota archaeon]|nr:hypothetical protein [Candidatus Thermoplasmatota archaeon]
MLGWLALLGGIAYGYFSPGRQDLKTLLKKGLLYGLILAVILAVVGILLNFSILGFGDSFIANIIGAVIVVLLFVAGVWFGDWLEHRRGPKTTATTPRP